MRRVPGTSSMLIGLLSLLLGVHVLHAIDVQTSVGSYETTQTLSASGTIQPGTANLLRTIPIQGNASAVTLTSNPQIAAGSVAGQVIRLCGAHATQTVTLSDGNGVTLAVSGTTLVFGTGADGKSRCEDFVYTGSTWLQTANSSGYGRWLGFTTETAPFRVCEDESEQNCPIYVFLHPTDGPKNRPVCNGGRCPKVVEIANGLTFDLQVEGGVTGVRVQADEIEVLDMLQRGTNPSGASAGRCKLFPKADGFYSQCGTSPVVGPLGSPRNVVLWDLPLAGLISGTAGHVWDDDPLSTGACTPTAVTGTSQSFATCSFPDSDGDYGRQLTKVLPPGWTGSMDLDLWFRTTGTGQAIVQFQTVCYGDDATPDAAFNTAIAVTAVAGTSGRPNRATATGVPMGACAAEHLIRMRLFRNRTHANDTLNAPVEIEKVVLKLQAIN